MQTSAAPPHEALSAYVVNTCGTCGAWELSSAVKLPPLLHTTETHFLKKGRNNPTHAHKHKHTFS